MTSVMTAVTPEAASSNFAWLTTTHLILLGIVAIFAIAILIIGARNKAMRKAAESELRETGDAVSEERPLTDQNATDVSAQVLTPVPTPAPIPTMPTPVAPSPPPLADVPVVAAAPNDAAPASIAAELATPPADGADDLVRLKGVGPKLAARLNELGITRFDQIAALSPAEADALDAQLGTFRGRLMRDRWIEQARYLATGDTAGFEAAFGKL